ncbi:Cgl0159 family (beta/alpha)8-fold protein, partial [Streptomyces albidoflavus]|uniref:Cgl0159 family (beta/alpha)8-fold protein n=1 Tax=Streptomyces albidoflavus TaxID=1886 RepID=UPI003FA20648
PGGDGGTSAYTWLKVPVPENPEDMARVTAATTLPVVLLGGPVGAARGGDAPYERWRSTLALPTVRGLVAGRALPSPPARAVARAFATRPAPPPDPHPGRPAADPR